MRWGACLVRREIINAELPHKINDIADVILVWCWCQEGFKEPFAAAYLVDVAELSKGRNKFMHNWDHQRAIVNFIDTDWFGGAGFDLA